MTFAENPSANEDTEMEAPVQGGQENHTDNVPRSDRVEWSDDGYSSADEKPQPKKKRKKAVSKVPKVQEIAYEEHPIDDFIANVTVLKREVRSSDGRLVTVRKVQENFRRQKMLNDSCDFECVEDDQADKMPVVNAECSTDDENYSWWCKYWKNDDGTEDRDLLALDGYKIYAPLPDDYEFQQPFSSKLGVCYDLKIDRPLMRHGQIEPYQDEIKLVKLEGKFETAPKIEDLDHVFQKHREEDADYYRQYEDLPEHQRRLRKSVLHRQGIVTEDGKCFRSASYIDSTTSQFTQIKCNIDPVNARQILCDVYVRISEMNKTGPRNLSCILNAVSKSLPRLREFEPFVIENTHAWTKTQARTGFQLTLRDYQQRTLTWLSEIEADMKNKLMEFDMRKLSHNQFRRGLQYGSHVVQLGDGPFYDTDKQKFSAENPIKSIPVYKHSIPCNGAILADNPGTGKTIVALALIHSRPFESVNDIAWPSETMHKAFLISRATMIVCPPHLAKQWKAEAIRCMPNAKVHLLTTILDHRKLTWNDALLADIIIVSLNFLQNGNYGLQVKRLIKDDGVAGFISKLKDQGRKQFGNEVGRVLLQGVMWHRVICDEFHELGDKTLLNKKNAKMFFLNELNARFFLGLTGTPQYKTIKNIVEMASYLNTDLPHKCAVAKEFLSRMVRRNEPHLGLPAIISRFIWVEMSHRERGLYQGMLKNRLQALMACNHFHLADQVVGYAGEEILNIDQVAELVQKGRRNDIVELTERVKDKVESTRKNHEQYAKWLATGDRSEEFLAKVAAMAQRIQNGEQYIREKTQLINDLTAQYNFFHTMQRMIKSAEPQTCPMCLDVMEEGSKIAIGKCGHVHCDECITELLACGQPKCTMCRIPLAAGDVSTIVMKNENKTGEEVETVQKHDASKYGSKLVAFMEFMEETVAAKPESKIILFVQFRRLMTYVSNALAEVEIDHVSCSGNIHQRSNAVDAFKTNPQVRLILLSSEDSVSGLHLVEATHVVIFHPFYIGGNQKKRRNAIDDEDAEIETVENSTDLALAYEKQGIARAWRGGLDHEIELVRFMVRDSLEEELSGVRNYKEGVITDLDEDYVVS